jgi:hypothetical protein
MQENANKNLQYNVPAAYMGPIVLVKTGRAQNEKYTANRLPRAANCQPLQITTMYV